MPSRVKLPPSQEEDVVAVCGIGPDRLREVDAALRNGPFVIRRDQIEKALSGIVGESETRHLARMLFGIAVALRQDDQASARVLDNISAFAKSRVGDDSNLKAWEACRPIIESILLSKSLQASAKALDVSYDFERIYMHGRIVTSVRPVFNYKRDAIVGATIVQTLRLEYATDGESHSLSFAMDAKDLAQLERSCREAMTKAGIANEQVSTKWGLPTLLPGETFDE